MGGRGLIAEETGPAYETRYDTSGGLWPSGACVSRRTNSFPSSFFCFARPQNLLTTLTEAYTDAAEAAQDSPGDTIRAVRAFASLLVDEINSNSSVSPEESGDYQARRSFRDTTQGIHVSHERGEILQLCSTSACNVNVPLVVEYHSVRFLAGDDTFFAEIANRKLCDAVTSRAPGKIQKKPLQSGHEAASPPCQQVNRAVTTLIRDSTIYTS